MADPAWPALVDALPGFDETAVLAAADDVRDYCGWHVAPIITETVRPLSVGAHNGRLMLPTLQLLQVNSVTVDGQAVAVHDMWRDGSVWVDRYRLTYYPGSHLREPVILANITHGFPSAPGPLVRTLAYLAQDGLVPKGRLTTKIDGPYQRVYAADSEAGLGWCDRYRLITAA